jgi:hypothetical protein
MDLVKPKKKVGNDFLKFSFPSSKYRNVQFVSGTSSCACSSLRKLECSDSVSGEGTRGSNWTPVTSLRWHRRVSAYGSSACRLDVVWTRASPRFIVLLPHSLSRPGHGIIVYSVTMP